MNKNFRLQPIFIIAALIVAVSVSAQDVIVKRDGSTILSKILEVNQDNIKYKKFKNLKGPTYTISIADIMVVNYENGDRDEFSSSMKQNSPERHNNGMIKKTADSNNKNIIDKHNIIHPNFDGKEPSNKNCNYCTVKYGVHSTSIMSNGEIEMEFVRKIVCGYDYDDELCYFINIRNKTDKVLYIDRGNCFKVYNDGSSYCYFDASKQTTVNNGGGSGGSVNIGSLAGAFGIGGTIGQIASGVNVGGGTSSSISTSYAPQRVIAIAPHGSKYLSENIWIGEGKRRTCVEYPEDFIHNHSPNYLKIKSTREIGLKRGDVKKNSVIVFDENELPWRMEYFITYSLEENFSSYSTLHAKLFIQEIIGENPWSLEIIHKKEKWFQNDNIIVGVMFLDK